MNCYLLLSVVVFVVCLFVVVVVVIVFYLMSVLGEFLSLKCLHTHKNHVM